MSFKQLYVHKQKIPEHKGSGSQHDLPEEHLVAGHREHERAAGGEVKAAHGASVTQEVLERTLVVVHQLGYSFCVGMELWRGRRGI